MVIVQDRIFLQSILLPVEALYGKLPLNDVRSVAAQYMVLCIKLIDELDV